MNWADISKEKKQALILIGMWVLGGVFALYQFVLMPFIRSRGASSTERPLSKNSVASST